MARKTYKLENFNGNIIESLESFSRQFPKQHIVEASLEECGDLKIIASDEPTEESVEHFGDEQRAVRKLEDLQAKRAALEKELVSINKQINALLKYID